MEYLIYISTATRLLNEQELKDILTVSHKNNEEHKITGVLLYAEGTFMQLLEGAPDRLNAAYENIVNDTRHKNIIKLIQSKTDEPIFPDWLMGFKRIDTGHLETLKGYFKPDQKAFNSNNDKHPGVAIIKTFAEANLMF